MKSCVVALVEYRDSSIYLWKRLSGVNSGAVLHLVCCIGLESLVWQLFPATVENAAAILLCPFPDFSACPTEIIADTTRIDDDNRSSATLLLLFSMLDCTSSWCCSYSVHQVVTVVGWYDIGEGGWGRSVVFVWKARGQTQYVEAFLERLGQNDVTTSVNNRAICCFRSPRRTEEESSMQCIQ